jgi:hypothetical protein
MPDNPRHKRRFSTLPTNRTTDHPVLGSRFSLIEQIKLLREKAEEELAKRQLEREQLELAKAARATKNDARKQKYKDRIAELEDRKKKFKAAEQLRINARQAKREETGGAAPSMDEVKSALARATENNPTAQAAISALKLEEARQSDVARDVFRGIDQPQDVDSEPPSLSEAKEMLVQQAGEPLYTDPETGESIYMEDVVALGGAGRLRAISKAARPIQEAFFKMIHRLKLARRLKGKPPADPSRILPKAGMAATAAGAGVGTGIWLGDEGMLPSLEHVGEGRVVPRLPDTGADEQTVAPVTEPLRVDDEVTPEADPRESGLPIYTGERQAGPPGLGKPAHDPNDVGGVDVSEASPEKRQALERTWGKWTYNPRQRRDRYMEQLNSIYRKGAWLDAIAGLTGNPSRSGAYIQRAVAKMEAMQMFDQEERIYNIWRDVYFRPDGTYDAPANKAEAARRARRLGASPQEVKKIYGWTEEGPDLQQWYRVVDGELETTQTKGKKVKPKGDGWIMGTPPSGLQTGTAVSHINWTDGDRTITLEKGQTPQSVGHTGDWYKGTGKDPGKVPGGKPAIDFIENVYLNSVNGGADAATAKAQAADARFLQYKQNPEMYGFISGVTDEMMRTSALAEIENIIASFEARGRKSYSSQGAASGTESVNLGAID